MRDSAPSGQLASYVLRASAAAAVLLAAAASAPPVAWAQPTTAPERAGPPPVPAPPELPRYEDVIRGLQAVPGLITFYREDPSDPARDHTRLLAFIPRALLNQDLMLANSVSRGPNFGFPLDDGILIRWEQIGNRLLLVAPDTRLKAEGRGVINEAVRATYRPGILAGLPILAATRTGSVDGTGGLLVDFAPLIYSGVSGAVQPRFIRRDLSRVVSVKSFPENVLIDVDLAIGDPAAPGPLNTIGIAYAIRRLPPLGSYTPRVADERVGFFTTVRQDWTTRYDERDTLTRYINRWNVRKQDPTLELSPPERPIVFIIERTVPIQFRRFVAQGVLEWNRAFEEIGITGAIVVQQQTDDNEFANIDPEDARYNFIRWIVTGRGFAMGPSRPDPRTGQLLDADIIFDDSMVRFYNERFEVMGPKALSQTLGEGVVDFFRAHPAFLPAGVELPPSDLELMHEISPSAQDPDTPTFLSRVRGTDALARVCSIGNGLRQRISMARLAAEAAGGRKLPDRLIGEIIKDITSHEVGHTLGLRHNFKASSWLTIDEIRQRRDQGGQATTASTMDYNDLLFFPGDKVETLRHITSPTIGPYDIWAIKYGYSFPPAGTSEADHLEAIASRTNEPGLGYASDEDIVGFTSVDPRVNHWDMSSDPVAWARMRLTLVDELLKTSRDWAIDADDPAYYFRSVLGMLLFERVRSMPHIARIVSGQLTSKSRLDDPNAAPGFTLLPPAQQRDALRFLHETVFTESFFNIDPSLFNVAGPSRWWDWASTPAARLDYPFHAAMLSMQAGTLASLTSPQTLQRVYDAERKTTAEDRFTAAELIRSVRDGLFTELENANGRFTDARPMIGSIRRNLQQQYIQNKLSIAELRPGVPISPDLQNMVRFALRELSDRIGTALENGNRLDFASRAHLSEAKIRIDRVLEAPFVPPGAVTATAPARPAPASPQPALSWPPHQ